MKITCVGGGPAGLYFAILMKLQDSGHEITVLERDSASASGGWGITVPHNLLRVLAANDAETARKLRECSLGWETHVVDVQGHRTYFAQTGLSLTRQSLVDVFRERAASLRIDLQFDCKVEDVSQLDASDLIIASDGINSRVRELYSEQFETSLAVGRNMYVWLGTTKLFTTCTFSFVETDAGWIWFHADGLKDGSSACVVECSPETWTKLGLDRLGTSEGLALLARIFERPLDGHAFLDRSDDAERLAWTNFRTVTNQKWHHGNIALMGDAARTTHFTLGSGTRLALEDAMSLATKLRKHDDLQSALVSYQRERQSALHSVQRDARNSARWFESIPRYIGLEAGQFASLLQYRFSPLLAHMPPSAYYRLRLSAPKWPALRRMYRLLR